MRVVVTTPKSFDLPEDVIKQGVANWLGQMLEGYADGLKLSPEKTQITAIGATETPLVRQSAKMNRIQSAISGGLDALEGEEILDTIQGLMRAQDALGISAGSDWKFSPVTTEAKKPLRICVVQTVFPTDKDFEPDDLSLDGKAIRRKHRNHLSAALAAVKRMLILRKTHKGNDGCLDWLILPELAVHPKDVNTHYGLGAPLPYVPTSDCGKQWAVRRQQRLLADEKGLQQTDFSYPWTTAGFSCILGN